ncbi:2-C-methyl-D-erythritol 4-phosphate cytidylyltransferase [Effusibacillus dendaii]|uniref:2-C-methyl-D-erythritol 4-phosphate cytidylyltransferase n=1 Tax=Effusibacillus dendaii TaxID=2743772 RepID=UPI001CF78C90|nr:2-C-methyl-D-erythritol 4-phosphate cytidylyltransferase [Effusibacillus dendaii]
MVAAGSGSRMNSKIKKQFMELAGVPILIHTLRVLEQSPLIDQIVLVIGQEDLERVQALIDRYKIRKVTHYAAGGQERQASVWNGLQVLRALVDMQQDLVIIHDAARPLVSTTDIERIVESAREHSAVTIGTPAKDTIKKVNNGWVEETLLRHQLYAVQTPQGFRASLLYEAHEKAMRDNHLGTDDASLVEWAGAPVWVVEGSYRNIKITTPEDLQIAASFLQEENIYGGKGNGMRIGTGFDVHRFAEGRPLVIGGVTIPFEKGLLGHSDADVLLHAVKDALLGAIAEGDIGQHFPDTDERFRGANSVDLLKHVWQMVKERGYRLGNLDCTIMAQRPKLRPYIEEMKAVLAKELEAELSQINVKATTTERLGFVGREEGIAAEAVVLLMNVL